MMTHPWRGGSNGNGSGNGTTSRPAADIYDGHRFFVIFSISLSLKTRSTFFCALNLEQVPAY